jgi:hypothetical protein
VTKSRTVLIQPAVASATAMPGAPRRGNSVIASAIDHDGDGRKPHRRLGVLAGVETRLQRLDQHESRQADAIDGKDRADDAVSSAMEGTALIKHADDLVG